MKRLALISLLLASGCATVPPTNVHQPMSMRPQPRQVVPNANGAIYQAASARPLFEDRRARFVGDTLTVTISESTSASKSATNKVGAAGSQTASAGTSIIAGSSLPQLSLGTSSSTAFSGSGEAANKAAFTGSMTVTVIDVYPNGNLLVSGEKQMAIGQEQEFVRVSGVVNPAFVDVSNTIDSSKIADARIELKSSGQTADSQVMGWLARFFLNVLPF
jgi:flagellar L-ring protein precursor FlgH